VDLIRQHTTFLGEDGEAVMREIQEDAAKPGCLPADIARVIEKYCQDLARKLVVVDLKGSNQVPKIYEAPYLSLLNREHPLARINTEKAHKEGQ
jgi:hydroxymethylpyrimidine/phosphomethylpyrimidine kinase